MNTLGENSANMSRCSSLDRAHNHEDNSCRFMLKPDELFTHDSFLTVYFRRYDDVLIWVYETRKFVLSW